MVYSCAHMCNTVAHPLWLMWYIYMIDVTGRVWGSALELNSLILLYCKV